MSHQISLEDFEDYEFSQTIAADTNKRLVAICCPSENSLEYTLHDRKSGEGGSSTGMNC